MEEPHTPNSAAVPATGSLSQGRPRKSFYTFINLLTLALILATAFYQGWPDGLRMAMAVLFLVIVAAAMTSTHAPIMCRCILPLLIGGICVEGYIVLNETEALAPVTQYFVFGDKYNENFYSGLATLYAIITALALVKGIEDFDGMKRNITDEAYKVRSISGMTNYFDESDHAQTKTAIIGIRQKLIRYAANVAAMRDQEIRSENLGILRSCQADISVLKPRDDNDHHSLQIIVEAHGELGTLRAKRINSVGEKIPRYLIAALWLMALSLILPFMAEPLTLTQNGVAVPNPARFGQYYIIFLLGSINSFLLLMLSDISDPFDGFWKINLAPFDELRHALGDEITRRERAEDPV